MYDILIKNGTVIDGTGEPGMKTNVAISKNKIAKIGELGFAKSQIEIDALGKIVAPGFVDIHNHSDGYWRIFLEPELPSLILQGITTIIGGNCGASIAPLTDGRIVESIQKWADIKQVNVDWLSFSEFAEKMSGRKLAINFGSLVGHGTLRRGLTLDEMRCLNQHELDVVGKILQKSFEEGALGLSTGLAYSHEREAGWDELVKLAEIAKENERFYSTHLRDESGNILAALQEAIDLARQTGVSLEVSHLKVIGEKNWPLMDEVLTKIEKAQKAGVDINFDVYPYPQIGSVLYIFLPAWAADGGKKMLLGRLKEKHLRKKIIEEMKETARYHYEDALIAICPFAKSLTKRKISEVASERGVSIEEVIVDLLVASEGRVVTIAEVLSEENVKKAIEHPLSIIATDGAGYGADHKESGELVHPRCFGTFPRVLGKYVREEKLLTIEEAVKKMTSLPAGKIGLPDRGRLEKGYQADVVVFDLEKIRDLATVENPYQYSEGIEQVIVNGKFALRDGKLTNEMAGEFISS
jgi:N-acyl-D-aspartate/D-glutamate deacylase